MVGTGACAHLGRYHHRPTSGCFGGALQALAA
uniref:Uncharacterized protein n=1 Tax=Variovorax paradoxus (strain S110) TaxID=543728 RepID=C5CL07_VARPS